MHNKDQHKCCEEMLAGNIEPPKMTDRGFNKTTYQRETDRDRKREERRGGQKLYNYCNCATAVRLMRETVRQRTRPSLCLALQQRRRNLFHPKCFQTAKQHFLQYVSRHSEDRSQASQEGALRDFLETRVEKNAAKVSGADR